MTMSRQHAPLRGLLLAAVFTSTTIAMPANSIFTRQNTCSADQIACPSPLPGNFCCPAKSECTPLAGGTTALCCPTGRKCNKIQPITCNIQEQNVSEHPDAPIKTTVFDVEMEKCGSNTCCPFGYSCSETNECLINSDQSIIPQRPETSSSTTAGPSPTSSTPSNPSTTEIATTTASPTSTGAPSEATDADSEPAGEEEEEEKKSDSGPATTSIIGGVVGSALLVLCVAIIIFLYIRRRNRRNGGGSEKHGHDGRPGTASTIGSFGNIISEPIAQPNSYRTDFILKTPSPSSRTSTVPRSYSTPPSTMPKNTPRVRISIPNPFDSPSPSPNRPSPSPPDDRLPRTGNVMARLPPIRAMKASSYWGRRSGTTELQREPSSESISVFADPNTVNTPPSKPRRQSRGTTFTDLMDEADLGDVTRGRPYVPGTTPRI